jgi:methylmalonyl-CoA mutase C-terminal domain/subunit
VVKVAMEEDVEVIGVSSLATDHLLLPKLVAALGEAGLGHVAVVVGGIVPPEDEPALRRAGVAQIFHPGSPRDEIVAEVSRLAHAARAAAEGGV